MKAELSTGSEVLLRGGGRPEMQVNRKFVHTHKVKLRLFPYLDAIIGKRDSYIIPEL